MNKINKKIWLAVDTNLVLSEHDSMKSALEIEPLFIFLEKEGIWKNGAYDNYAYDVEFYNKEGLKVDGASMNNWRISNLKISDGGFSTGYARHSINFSVMDPWGVTENRYFGIRRTGITSALIFLQASSKYYSWSEYRQADPEEKERSVIHMLEQKVEDLKAENERMKAKLASIQEILTRDSTEVE